MQGGRIYDSENGTTCHQVCMAARPPGVSPLRSCCQFPRMHAQHVLGGVHGLEGARMPQQIQPLRAQCRQKTVEVKASCGRCTLHWCPRCLFNRYGEEVAAINAVSAVNAAKGLAGWACPRCRGDCNCSNCRKV